MAFSEEDNTTYKCQVPTELVTKNILKSSLDSIFSVIQNTISDPELTSMVNLTSSLLAKRTQDRLISSRSL